jgi:hypothetical protein
VRPTPCAPCSSGPAAISRRRCSRPGCSGRCRPAGAGAGSDRAHFATLQAPLGGVAQPGRALRSQRRSRGFKSHHLHHRSRRSAGVFGPGCFASVAPAHRSIPRLSRVPRRPRPSQAVQTSLGAPRRAASEPGPVTSAVRHQSDSTDARHRFPPPARIAAPIPFRASPSATGRRLHPLLQRRCRTPLDAQTPPVRPGKRHRLRRWPQYPGRGGSQDRPSQLPNTGVRHT